MGNSLAPEAHEAVLKALEKAGIPKRIRRNRHGSEEHRKARRQERQAMLRLYEVLEEHDDVQNVYGNYEMDEEEVEALA